MRLDLLGLMLGCGSLHVTLATDLGELLLPHVAPLLQVVHQGIDFAYLRKQAGVVFLKPVHPGELVGQLVTFVARHLLQPLQMEGREQKNHKNAKGQVAGQLLTSLT